MAISNQATEDLSRSMYYLFRLTNRDGANAVDVAIRFEFTEVDA